MRRLVTGAVASLAVVAGLAVAPAAVAAPANNDRAADVVDHWTPQRLAAAEPRDLLIDERGLGYQRDADGRLKPHGHRTAAASPATKAKPGGGGGDTTGPTIGAMSPGAGTTIGPVHTFSAAVSDPSGVKTVSFVLTAPDRRTTTYPATSSGTTWSAPRQNLAPGKWSWTVQATDSLGNVRASSKVAFTVSAKAPSDSPVTVNAGWSSGGAVQSAAGRIYFEMPADSSLAVWDGYVCSGTVVADPVDNDRSIILTAAHCVFDDVNHVFARNVLFIPDQAGTTDPDGTDTDCSNDTYGCWAPTYGLVDTDWTTRTFPDNIAWDYAYYVVPTQGRHEGTAASSESLEEAVGTLTADFAAPAVNLSGNPTDFTHALGYSYSDDPNFMYCSEDMTIEGADNWWLPNCGLSGGASGGPWLQPVSGGSGPVISVNSWGYTNRPGMAGPKLSGTSAESLFAASQFGAPTGDGGSAVPVS